METENLASAAIADTIFGFRLEKKQFVASQNGTLYTLCHVKTGAELLYFDRLDENRSFSIAFKTIPEDDTGVFHILEHSVLNGSRRYPVKEPFVSLLQSSMQTFLNAMTFGDKTVYPVSSRNEQDLMNLMSVYLDAVFFPRIYECPEIFMQEGWHYEFEGEDAPTYNGVVFSEMKGAFADVDTLMESEMSRLLFPDTGDGYVSGGAPEHIPELTYEKFIQTHKRFYHPSNAKIFLDGHMNVEHVLEYIDGQYLSRYEYRKPDFDFVMQMPKTGEKTVRYASSQDEENHAHMTIAKILCTHSEVEKLYAAEVLAGYLTGSNEAPLTRAFLEAGLAQDVTLQITDGMFQPTMSLIVRNTEQENFEKIRSFVPETIHRILSAGLDRTALSAALERFAFRSREIREPYGLMLGLRALDGWLYGDDPLTHIDNGCIFESLRQKLNTPFFAELLEQMLGAEGDKCYLYAIPSDTKATEDAAEEADRLKKIAASWSMEEKTRNVAASQRLLAWQQTPDSEDALAALPHLSLRDIPETVPQISAIPMDIAGTKTICTQNNTNGIIYINLYFDVSDLTVEQLQMLNVLATCMGELRTEHCTAAEIQNRIKSFLGGLSVKIDIISNSGELDSCTPYLTVSASMLEENAQAGLKLLQELMIDGKYDEIDRIGQIVAQTDYFQKQDLIGSGNVYAITKSLSAFSRGGAMKELLDGETFVRWFGKFAERFDRDSSAICDELTALDKMVFTRGRLFAGYCGNPEMSALSDLIRALPEGSPDSVKTCPAFDTSATTVEIPSDVGYSALGHNIYALGGNYSGSLAVLSSIVTYVYLWNAVRVQGGAYGTSMGIRANGDIFCHSYRDPNLENSRKVFENVADFVDSYLQDDTPLDDLIIGAVNTTDPLLDPAGVCTLACTRYLRGTTPGEIAKIRRELLHTTPAALRNYVELLRKYAAEGKYCAVGNRTAVAFTQ